MKSNDSSQSLDLILKLLFCMNADESIEPEEPNGHENHLIREVLAWRTDRSRQAAMLLELAGIFERDHDWRNAIAACDEALTANPQMAGAYMRRALICRCMGEFDAAIRDYSKAISLDPQNSGAWLWRGATKMQRSSAVEDYSQWTHFVTNEVYPDYRRAAELDPTDEQTGLCLVELEICIGRYRDAAGSAGVWWNRVQSPQNKVIAAWLGAMASVMLGKPKRKLPKYLNVLRQDYPSLDSRAWCTHEISRFLTSLAENSLVPEEKLRLIREIHSDFLRRFKHGRLF